MAILINKDTQFIVQGITGKEGQRAAKFMLAAGSKVVGGVRPGKAGEEVEGIKVFDAVKDIAGPVDFSVITVPPKFVKDAVVEAVEAGVKTVLPVAEGVPVHDTAWLYAFCKERGVRLIGPNTAGVITPGQAMAGLMGGRGKDAFTPGAVGIISKSGGMTSETARLLSQAGIGQSTCISIGGDKIAGTDIRDCLELFAADDDTKAIVLFGEVGGTYEEQAAEWVKASGFSKPIVAFITGQFAKRFPGVPLGHAGAIIERNKGTRRSKVDALESAGVTVVEVHHELVGAIKKVL